MKKNTTIKTAFALLFAASGLHAQNYLSTQTATLDVSNVSCGILAQGDMFWDAIGNNHFEVPKGSGKSTIFAQSLWLGGLDAGGSLHTACMTYRQTGVDFWPGPIAANGTAGVPATWDNIYKVNQSVVLNHMANYNTSGYAIPAEIANWPANGPSGFAPILAPFGDFNNNQIYDPQNGDYPAIMGDQACYLIYNDAYAAHTESAGNPIGVEVHCMIYEINDPVYQDVRNTVFARYIIANKSGNNYTDFHIALWADFDIGDASDDYVGTDVGRNMIYGYNGDSVDGIYGTNPPAQGVVFLNHPLTASMYYNNVNGTPNGNPATALHYYDYMKAIYGDGQQMTFGADGRNPVNPTCNFFCPDNTDPAFAGSSWTEASAGNAPGDRRMLGGVGPYNLNAGDFISFDVAYVFGVNGVASLQTAVDNIQTLYNQKLLTATAHLNKKNAIEIYPNPAADFLNVDLNGLQSKLEVSIINSSGQLVKSFRFTNVEKTQIDISDLNSGVYQLKLNGENSVINKSFTIVR